MEFLRIERLPPYVFDFTEARVSGLRAQAG
jgi:hypothetical protein